MGKIKGKIFIIVFFTLLYLPMIFADYERDVSSELDNKKLAEFPKIGQEDFNDRVEEYVEDRVGFRTPAITVYQYLCDRLFHILVHPEYMYGTDDEIYSPADLTTYQNLDVDEDYIDIVAKYLGDLSEYCRREDSGFIFFFCPNKESVYYENFPKGYNKKDQPNRSDRIVKKLDENDVNYLFPREMYRDQKDKELFYNHRYDVLHWNQTGCFYGMKELIKLENRMGYNTGELKEDEFQISEKTEKYLQQSRFIINDTVPDYRLIEDNTVNDSEEYFREDTDIDRDHYHYHFLNPGSEDKPRVLVAGDSYFGNSLAKDSLKVHSSELLMIHIRNMDHIKGFIDVFHPDIVVVEAVEREFGEGEYWSPENIRKWIKAIGK